MSRPETPKGGVASLLSFLSLFRIGLALDCYQMNDCIPNCADLIDECGTKFCPGCELAGYCDVTCQFCSVTSTSTTTVTRDCDFSEDLMGSTWCAQANQPCLNCDPPTSDLCGDLFCPTCTRAGDCDKFCGFCSTSTSTSTTKTVTSTTKTTTITSTSSTTSLTFTTTSTVTTTTGTTTSTTKTVTSTTTTWTSTSTTVTTTTMTTTSTVCHNSDFGAKDINGKWCALYTEPMCAVDMNDEDFDAQTMCCVCQGGVKACKDTDFGSTDAKDDTCEAYTNHDDCGEHDDEDFEAMQMCCSCGGGGQETTKTVTTTTTTTITVPVLDEQVGLAVIPWPLLLIPLLLCLPCCLLPLLWKMFKKPTDRSMKPRECFPVDPVEPKKTGNCFILDELKDGLHGSGMEVTNDSFWAATTATGGAREVKFSDTASESTASIYATTCELFRRVDLYNDTISMELSKDDNSMLQAGDCVVTGCAGNSTGVMRPRGGRVQERGFQHDALSGAWRQHGRTGWSADVRGTRVTVYDPALGTREMHITTMDDGRIALQEGGCGCTSDVLYGQLLGSRLLWENGETWSRRPTISEGFSARGEQGDASGNGRAGRVSAAMGGGHGGTNPSFQGGAVAGRVHANAQAANLRDAGALRETYGGGGRGGLARGGAGAGRGNADAAGGLGLDGDDFGGAGGEAAGNFDGAGAGADAGGLCGGVRAGYGSSDSRGFGNGGVLTDQGGIHSGGIHLFDAGLMRNSDRGPPAAAQAHMAGARNLRSGDGRGVGFQ